MNEGERIRILSDLVPEFQNELFEMRRTLLKYGILTKRLSSN